LIRFLNQRVDVKEMTSSRTEVHWLKTEEPQLPVGAGGVAERLFWEHVAAKYTAPFEEKLHSRTLRVLDIASRAGLIIEGSKVLDIGCGTGAFALPFARAGASVTALDTSENMLKKLSIEADRHNLAGIEIVRGCWKEINHVDSGFAGRFDSVVCGFSTAVETEDDIRKMEQCSKRWCVYVASGRIHRAPMFREMLRMLRAPLRPRPDVRTIRGVLGKMKRAVVAEMFVDSTERHMTSDEVARMLALRLEAAGKTPRYDRIRATIAHVCGKYEHQEELISLSGEVEVGVLIWRVDES